MNWNNRNQYVRLSLATMLCALVETHAMERPLWMRYPNISPDGTQIVFTYRGDLYTVSSQGGEARRLTTNEAYECYPIWAPDGSQIAFTSDRYQRGMNIYIMDANGGEARQLTTHSGNERPYSFSPDGKYVLFKAHISDPARSMLFPGAVQTELYRVPVIAGRTECILAAPAEYAVMNSAGTKVLYQDIKGYENEWRKHHTSSVTRDIVEYDLQRKTFRSVINHPGEDRNPLYAPDDQSVYFLSERGGGTMNVYRSDLRNGELTQLTQFTGEPVRFLSIDRQGTLCFGYGGEIYTLIPGDKPRRVPITLTHDEDDSREGKLSLSSGMTSVTSSPDGKLVAYTIRGEVFVSTVDYSTTRRITSTAAAEHGVTFGKDGRTIVYASSRDGHWELYRSRMTRAEDPNMANATILKEERLIPELSGEKTYPQFSPDGKEIAFVYERKRLVVYNLETRQLRYIMPDNLLHNGPGALDYKWSPDGRWFTFAYVARAHAPYTDIGIVRADGSKQIVNLTNSGYTDHSPRWVLDGNAILYRSDRFGMRNHASWGSMDDVMLIFLNRASYEKYRMTEEELAYHEESQKKEKASTKTSKDSTTVAPVKSLVLELEHVEDRRVRLTEHSARLADAILSPDGKKLYYLAAFEGDYDLWTLDLAKKKAKLSNKLNTSRPMFVPDPSGKQIFILGSTAQKLDPKGDALKAMTFSAEMKIDYMAERAAMYDEVVREEGLRFYRADMHGVDWKALTEHYRRYLPHIGNNYDFAEMLSELLGELNVSHTGAGYRSPAYNAAEPTAELGLFIDDQTGQDGLLVEEVISGGPFDTSTSQLRAGDVITAIDGTPITAGMDYFPLLAGKANKYTIITYRQSRSGHTVDERIKPISASTLSSLLYRRWVRQRAAIVERLSGGALGYVHIPSMGDPSFREAYSEVLGRYYGRKGIIIDIRHNGGGRLHEDIEVFFGAKKYLQQEIRGVDYCEMPSRRWNHASIMLVCEDDYSNAHGTPWVYQQLGIGKVIGMPVPGTMTSVNWVTLQDPSLFFGIPSVGYRTAEGTYLENAQLEPDIIAPLDMARALAGEDTQLEAAVRALMQEVEK